MNLTPEERQIEKQVKEIQPSLLKSLPGPKKKELYEFLAALSQNAAEGSEERRVVLSQTQFSSSPVPPAELLEGYNSAFPDGADRLFSLVESQSAHRQGLETKVIDSQIKTSSRGQILAFVLALIFGAIGLYFGIIGQTWLAGCIFSTTTLGLVTTFIVGKKGQEKSLRDKAPGQH